MEHDGYQDRLRDLAAKLEATAEAERVSAEAHLREAELMLAAADGRVEGPFSEASPSVSALLAASRAEARKSVGHLTKAVVLAWLEWRRRALGPEDAR